MASITFKYQYTDDGYVLFSKKVISGKFSGASNFGVLDDSLREAVSCLSAMYNDLSGVYQLSDDESSDFILFEFLKYGHLKISGQVGGCHRENYLVYQFMTDQTALKEIISDLSKMISSEGR